MVQFDECLLSSLPLILGLWAGEVSRSVILAQVFTLNLNEREARPRYISFRQFRGQLTIADDNSLSAPPQEFPLHHAI